LDAPPAPSRILGWTRRPIVLTLYLLAISIGAFALPEEVRLEGVAALLALQFAILALTRNISLEPARLLFRLKFLYLFILLCNALLPGELTDRYYDLFWSLRLNLTGLERGAAMCGQIATVVLASYVVRVVGGKDAFLDGLRSLRVTPLLAYSLDLTLAMLSTDAPAGPRRGRGGGGGGGGMGRGRRRDPHAQEADAPADATTPNSPDAAAPERVSIWTAIRTRDLSPFLDSVRRSLESARARVQERGLDPAFAHDVAVIGGVATVMMTLKIAKFMPGVAVFPGYKVIFYFPLYILAACLTRSRFGATLAGTIMGVIGFLNGDGRYGVLELAKHIAPGLLIDLAWPVLRRLPRRVWIFCALGLIAAVARTSTEFVIVLAIDAGPELYAFPVTKLLPNLVAGLLSGFVTYPLIARLGVPPSPLAPPDGPVDHEASPPSVVLSSQVPEEVSTHE
jgi:hypothetical protein